METWTQGVKMATDYVAAYCTCGTMQQVPRDKADDFICRHCREEKSRIDTSTNERELEEDGVYINDRYPADKELNFN
jgi:Zn finger protein HypA/HybF involved in hydrogenase expression